MPLADQMGPQLREFALAKARKSPEQLFSRYQREHGVPQELQLLVVGGTRPRLARLRGLQFTGLRAMGQGLVEKFGMLEAMPPHSFQRRHFLRFHVDQASFAGSRGPSTQLEPSVFRL